MGWTQFPLRRNMCIRCCSLDEFDWCLAMKWLEISKNCPCRKGEDCVNGLKCTKRNCFLLKGSKAETGDMYWYGQCIFKHQFRRYHRYILFTDDISKPYQRPNQVQWSFPVVSFSLTIGFKRIICPQITAIILSRESSFLLQHIVLLFAWHTIYFIIWYKKLRSFSYFNL